MKPIYSSYDMITRLPLHYHIVIIIRHFSSNINLNDESSVYNGAVKCGNFGFYWSGRPGSRKGDEGRICKDKVKLI